MVSFVSLDDNFYDCLDRLVILQKREEGEKEEGDEGEEEEENDEPELEEREEVSTGKMNLETPQRKGEVSSASDSKPAANTHQLPYQKKDSHPSQRDEQIRKASQISHQSMDRKPVFGKEKTNSRVDTENSLPNEPENESTEIVEDEPVESLVTKEEIEYARRRFFGDDYDKIMKARQSGISQYDSVFIEGLDSQVTFAKTSKSSGLVLPTTSSQNSQFSFGVSQPGSSKYAKDPVYLGIIQQHSVERSDREAALKLQQEYLEDVEN